MTWRAVVVLLLVARFASAQPVPHGGLRAVTTDASLTGTGASSSPLKIRVDCSTNDGLKWNGTTWVCTGGPSVTGSGTANTVAKWASASSLGNSSITDDGTTVVLSTNARGTTEDKYFAWDAGSSDRIGFVKKTGAFPRIAFGSTTEFAIAQSNGATIAAAGTFTDKLTISAAGLIGLVGNTTVTGTLATTGNTSRGDATTDSHTDTGSVTVYETIGTAIGTTDGLVVFDDTAQATGTGGALLLGGKYTNAGNYTRGVVLKAMKTNGTDGNYAFDFAIGTAVHGGAITERMRIEDNGTLLIKGANTNTGPVGGVSAVDFFTGRNNLGAFIAGQTTGDLAFSYGGTDGGYRHWISTWHATTANSANRIAFHVNNSATLGGSSAPGTGNTNVLDLYGDASAKFYGALAVDGLTTTTGGISSIAAANTFGEFRGTVTSPASIGAHQNDYAGCTTNTKTCRLTSSSTYDITGMTGGDAGEERALCNIGSWDLTLRHQDALSSAANRMILLSSLPHRLTVGGCVDFVYDATTGQWRQKGSNFISALTVSSGLVVESSGLTTNSFLSTGTGSIQGNLTVGDATTDTATIWGHIIQAGTAPTVDCTGSTTETIVGTDVAGRIATGAGATACTITFQRTYTATPSCVVTAQDGTARAYTVSATVITLTAASASQNYNYRCDCIGGTCT